MCGIVGYIDKNVINENVLMEMMEKIRHRGPDGSGFYMDDMIALGHRRLSIIDLEGGIQPMKNENGWLVCIFNGEIYNYQELRNTLLDAGHIFVTNSDTEVLLHGYEEWGKELPLKIRGMFAFAIWNKKKKELFCARDHFGVKPFYYFHKDNTFLFGSEIKSFLAHPNFEKKLNREQLELYLTYQYSPGETTFFQNTYKLLPAHYLIWKEGNISIEKYWEMDFEPEHNKTIGQWAEEIHKAMSDSVRVHKISDVEVGSYLSSGVDSSYITGLSQVKKTFTIGWKDKKYDEGKKAYAFSENVGVKNFVYSISPKEFWEKIPEIQYFMDEPLADAASAALFFLNREAAREVKVCLSGEGADELFGGYNIYKEPYMSSWYEQIPLLFRRMIGTIAEVLPPKRGVNFLVRHSRPLAERYIGNTTLFTERQKQKLLKEYRGNIQPTALARSYFTSLSDADDVTRMQFTDLHLWMVGDILLKADKMSMAHGLEVRVPFLDKEVFGVARSIPVTFRVTRSETKIALRKAAKRIVGEEIAKRKKLGFPVPVREWLKEEPYLTMVQECFDSAAAEEFFNVKELKCLLNEHIRGKQDNWRLIWCVYMFLIWYEEYFVKR